ncbi:hypothetical protein ILUMI_08157 [Ignelater luminosus]|uniref:deoxyhypusine synthase n=1 Tax=Ignelater luminosus TaxID=2038154 RepID=A0A8K0D657_IGNLU|nr:hypothetical protein ILUMI_08157 [Ignelater luminosus]
MSHNTIEQCINKARNAAYIQSAPVSFLTQKVVGYDWSQGVDYNKILETYLHTGFQATNFGLAVQELNKMIECRNLPLPECRNENNQDPAKHNCTIFLGYTSNIVSSGLRETIRFLVQHKLVDCIVTTAGGVEEDFIKCLAPTYIGDFNLDGVSLREKAINRTGNLLVPNDNYCKFEEWIKPILDEMLSEQKLKSTLWTPSKIIERLGERINNEESIYYWAAKNKIPVFSPALTDGCFGDIFFFHAHENGGGLVIDILSDVQRIDLIAMTAYNTGMFIIGGGLTKHHICNANLMRNGADYAVYVNTASEFDGSDAGAKPDEAKSWGKIKTTATPVKIHADATLLLPLLVGETFAKNHFKNNE